MLISAVEKLHLDLKIVEVPVPNLVKSVPVARTSTAPSYSPFFLTEKISEKRTPAESHCWRVLLLVHVVGVVAVQRK